MSYLLFMDESGHDHRTCPYEVRGGIALHAGKVWPFVQAMRTLEQSTFGDLLHRYKTELKGHKLLDKDRFAWAEQAATLDDTARRKYCLAFLNKGIQKVTPTRIEFTAYGQASLEMARGIFRLLREHEAVLFASAIPRGVSRPVARGSEDLLRKDHVFLLERYFYFLEGKRDYGLLVMDQTEKKLDRQFIREMNRYFTRTQLGRVRTQWVVPSPFFVSSDVTYPVQAADVCLYCVNWGFRLEKAGMDAPKRKEVEDEFRDVLYRLQFEGDGYKDGQVFHTYGIVFIPDPYTGRK